MSRRSMVRALLAAATGLAPVVLAAPAHASVAIGSFSVTPGFSQAGGTQSASGPDLALDSQFSDSGGDTPQNLTLSLAPGLLANPSVVPLCPAASFSAGACPSASEIGSGYVTGTGFGITLSLPAGAYLVQPQGSEVARIGLIVTFFGYPVATQSGPVTIRTAPDVGLDIPLTGLPREVDGVPVVIDGIHLKIFGEVDGHTFTRNPTTCSTVSSRISVDSYGAPSTFATSASSFTPTGCGALAYAPAISGSVAKDAGDDGIAVTTTVTQTYAEADSRTIELSFPSSASPRLSALVQACGNADLSTCPPVGTATVSTPLLSSSLTAQVVLVAHSGALPTLAILIPPPIGLTLTATPVLTGSSVQAIVDNVPDIPISSLTLNLPGGPSSLFRAGVHLCSDPQSFGGTFTAWSGMTAAPSSPATVSGCSGSAVAAIAAPGAPAPTPAALARGAIAPSSGPAGQLAIARGAGGAIRLKLAVGAGGTRSLRSLTLRFPAGLNLRRGFRSRVRVRLDGRPVAARISARGHRLLMRFARSGHVALITLEPGAFRRATGSRAGRAVVVFAILRRTDGSTRTLRLTGSNR